MIELAKYSIGVGDRFGHQVSAQIQAVKAIRKQGVTVIPIWNKSFREHSLTGTKPLDTRNAADAGVAAERWTEDYFVDADHITMENVESFVSPCDFFTLDVAGAIGKPAAQDECEAFVARHSGLVGKLRLPGKQAELTIDQATLLSVAERYLMAIREAGNLYRHIAEVRKDAPFVTEVSMDETVSPQTPAELLIILAGLAEENILLQTVAPKFSGEFHKGIDYIGDPNVFALEFDADISVIRYAIEHFGLPRSLKLSVHSGSDKFSLYPHIAASLKRHDAGVHIKTAGTSWLEEIIGLAATGGEGLALVKKIYRLALPQYEVLCKPYSTVISIRHERLPSADEVDKWSSEKLVSALEHESSNKFFNSDFRQFIHISFKIAAELGTEYTDALKEHTAIIGEHVTHNILERHLKPIFL